MDHSASDSARFANSPHASTLALSGGRSRNAFQPFAGDPHVVSRRASASRGAADTGGERNSVRIESRVPDGVGDNAYAAARSSSGEKLSAALHARADSTHSPFAARTWASSD